MRYPAGAFDLEAMFGIVALTELWLDPTRGDGGPFEGGFLPGGVLNRLKHQVKLHPQELLNADEAPELLRGNEVEIGEICDVYSG